MSLVTFAPTDAMQVTIRPRIYKVDLGPVGFQGGQGPTGPSSDRIVSVQDAPYNAAGDGSTDDTAAISAAKTAAGVDGHLFFPKGTYITTGLTADVAGQLWDLTTATLKLKNAASEVAVLVVTADNVEIASGTIDGNRTNQSNLTSGATTRHGIRVESAEGVSIHNVKVRRTVAAGIWLDNVTKVTVADNDLDDCGMVDQNHKMIQLWYTLGNSEGVRITNNRIDCRDQNNGGIGLSCVGDGVVFSEIQIQGNEIYVGNAGATATLGIEIFCNNTTAAIKDVAVAGNTILGVIGASTDQVYGISVGGPTSTALGGDTNISVVGNTIRDCAAFSIEIIGSCISAVGNTIFNSGEMLVAANEVTGGIRAVSITGNTFVDCGVANLAVIALVGDVNGIAGITVSGNSSFDAKSQGIRQTGLVSRMSLAGNSFFGTLATGISLAGTLTDSCVVGNILDLGGAAADWDAIQLGASTITRLLIEGNTIRNATRNGIYANAAASVIDIRNNNISGCTLHGINAATAVDRWSISGNRISSNDRGIIFFPAGTNINVYGNDVYSNPGGNYFLDGSTLVPFNIAGQDVSSGATDSGGTGFELLRTPNG